MEERMTREKMAHLGPRFWLVARDGDFPVEMFTMDCGGAASLPVFSHEEEAEMFLDLGGAGNGWRTRESSAGEIVSLLFGLCSRVSSVALDPSPLMTPEMLDLVRVDRGRFVDLITSPGEKKPLPRPRWILTPGLKNRGVA
jgi:hypothetical protein